MGKCIFKLKPLVIGLTMVSAVQLVACTHRQSVPGSYATPSKQVEGTALGIATTGILGPFVQGTASTLTAATTTGIAGNAWGSLAARHRLMNTLAEHGVQVIAQGDKLRIILPTDQFFQAGVPKLNPKKYPTLDFLAALLKEYGNTPILIAGYTDEVASAEQSQLISRQRAESVLGYLWVHGLEHRHLKAVGYGVKYPIATNATVAGSAANRRIEITLRDGC